jgi:hypothetical protein
VNVVFINLLLDTVSWCAIHVIFEGFVKRQVPGNHSQILLNLGWGPSPRSFLHILKWRSSLILSVMEKILSVFELPQTLVKTCENFSDCKISMGRLRGTWELSRIVS